MQINFYILSQQKKLIPFVCQLTQTVLQKSQDGLLIFIPTELIEIIDDSLWAFDNTAFVPHRVVNTLDEYHANKQGIEAILTTNIELLAHFNGLVMNLTAEPLHEVLNANKANKLFEIIDSEQKNILDGRQKYRIYQTNFPQYPIQTFHI